MGGVKVAGSRCYCLHSHASSSSPFSSSPHSFSSISSSSKNAKTKIRTLTCHMSNHFDPRSPFLGSSSIRLSRRRSLDGDLHGRNRSGSKDQILTRASSASLDSFDNDDDEEFVSLLQELALKLRHDHDCNLNAQFAEPHGPEPPKWLDRDEIVPEMKENGVDLPLSLRIIKRKQQQQQQQQRDETCTSSVNKAFSSMVFIVRELQSYALRMREVLLYENLQGILAKVQGDMNASFVWLFQRIFSCTPTLMVYVMLLLANFAVYSIAHHSAAAMAAPTTQSVAVIDQVDHQQTLHQSKRFDSPSIRSGGGGGGGNAKPVAGSTDDGGDGGDAIAWDENVEAVAWNRIVEQANAMQASWRDEWLMDPDTLRQLVAPVTVEMEPEDRSEHSQTEAVYHQALARDPDNVLLLSNFAQFLYLTIHDHDRAEHYFKRAVEAKPADAEALNRYASFLWLAKKDLGAAEEMYLEAIAADPGNSYYAANYAHFLWNTGGEDTCYLLDT